MERKKGLFGMTSSGVLFPPMLATSPASSTSESPTAKFVISAGVCWAYEFSLGHYLEFLKIMKQTKPGSYVQLTREMTAQKGIVGIWDGFFPWGTVQALAKGAVFGWGHALARQQLEPLVNSDTISRNVAEVAAGGIGGGFQGLVLSPTLLLKTRVMTDPIFRKKMSGFESTRQSAKVGLNVIQKEGISALMKGSVVFSMKRVADWSTRFMFSVGCEEVLYKKGNPQHELVLSERITASLLGGVLSSLVTIPIDVMVAQIQQASKAGSKVSVIETFQHQLKEGGISRVISFGTNGFIARVFHVAFTTMLMKTASSLIYEKYQDSIDEKIE